MKNIVIGICSCFLMGILVLTLYTMHGRSIRQEELDDALAAGMRTALEQVREGGSRVVESNEDLTAMFLQSFLMQLDSNSQVTVHIQDVDYEKGLLSVRAILTYRHPIGTEGRVVSEKTAIVEVDYGEQKE